MNLTLDQYIDGFERSVRELPSILAEWNWLDEELKDEYVEHLFWLLDARSRVIAESGERVNEIHVRLAAIVASLLSLRGELNEKMGVPGSAIVPYLAYAAPAVPDQQYAMAV